MYGSLRHIGAIGISLIHLATRMPASIVVMAMVKTQVQSYAD
jgi:hypothetical protein